MQESRYPRLMSRFQSSNLPSGRREDRQHLSQRRRLRHQWVDQMGWEGLGCPSPSPSLILSPILSPSLSLSPSPMHRCFLHLQEEGQEAADLSCYHFLRHREASQMG